MANKIHPTAIISDNVVLGTDNVIGPYSVISGPTEIGDNNKIESHVVIGSDGENTKDPRYDSSNSRVKIGNGNIIKEFSTIQKPCVGNITRVGNDTFMMHGTHIPHDAFIDDNVTLTPMVVVGGHVSILKGANIGMGSVLHQFSIIGQYSMVAAGAALVKNLKPFGKFIPGKSIRVNDYNIKKYNLEEYTDEIHKYILEGIMPTSDAVLAIVDTFEKLHVESNRPVY